MSVIDYRTVTVGDEIPCLSLPPVTRHTLALFCGASGDHNPIHVDIDYAKQAGLDDVIAHGMLSMAYLGRMLTNWIPLSALRHFDSRFMAITYIGDVLTCKGKVAEKYEEEGEQRINLELEVVKADGEQIIVATAVVAI